MLTHRINQIYFRVKIFNGLNSIVNHVDGLSGIGKAAAGEICYRLVAFNSLGHIAQNRIHILVESLFMHLIIFLNPPVPGLQ